MSDEQDSAARPAGGVEAPDRQRGLRDRPWVQALVVVVIVGGIGLLVLRLGHRDVVQDWQLLATCPADAGTAPSTVSTTLDTSDCGTAPSHSVSGRGWPIVAFVLPAAAGLEPSITAVHSDRQAGRMRVDYAAQHDEVAASTHDVVLAFIEVPPNDLPSTPFTVEGASGRVTVTTAPTS